MMVLKAFPEMKNWLGVADMPEVWWSEGFEVQLPQRVEALKQFLHERPEKTIAIVGHGGLFARILGYHLKNCGTAWVEWSAPDSSSDAYAMV